MRARSRTASRHASVPSPRCGTTLISVLPGSGSIASQGRVGSSRGGGDLLPGGPPAPTPLRMPLASAWEARSRASPSARREWAHPVSGCPQRIVYRAGLERRSDRQQTVAMSGVGIDLARFVESKLLQNTARGDIPSADSCPQPLVACLGCPSDHDSTRLGCIAEPVSPTQQLVGQFGLVGRAVPMEDQPAISDDIPRTLPLHRQDTRPRFLTLPAYLRGDVLHRRPSLGIYPSVRWHPGIPLHPQSTIDASLVHAPTPKDQTISLQSFQNGPRRHIGILPSLRHVCPMRSCPARAMAHFQEHLY